MFRQRRQQNRTERHAQHAGRQFGHTVGVIHPCDAAALQVGRENRADNQRNLRHARGENRRNHQFDDAVYRRIVEIQFRQLQKALFRQPRQLEHQLQHAADKHRPRQRGNRRVEIRHEKQGGHDERYVQQHGREGGNLEFVVGIEYRADERRERNQQDIGEHNPQQVGGQRQLVGIFAESGRRRTDNPRCGQHADGGNDGQRKRQHPRHILHKFPRRLRRLRLAVFRQNGNERLRKRAFCKNPPQQVRQLERGQKRVRRIARAKHPRNNHIAHESEYARHHRQAAELRQSTK